MPGLAAFFDGPIAHRGLHDGAAGIVENSASAVKRAVAAGYAVEVDLRAGADGEPVVFHDEGLERLTDARGPVRAHAAAVLAQIPLRGSGNGDRILRLDGLLALVAGRVPLIVELKSDWDGDTGLARRFAAAAARYAGPIAAKSFDPVQVATLGRAAPGLLRGIIGCRFAGPDWRFLPAARRAALRHLLHWPWTRPHFLSWSVADLPSAAVTLAHRLAGTPVMAWTVRTPAEQARAALYADQMLFEGFRP
jgi:glycerophosphoryl diester phosphodiesterase